MDRPIARGAREAYLRKPVRAIVLCVFLVGSFPFAAALAAPDAKQRSTITFKYKQAVPEGFEDLEQDETTLVDLYFGGEKVGSSMASYSGDGVAFSDPAAVADTLNLIDDEGVRASIVRSLTGTLSSNEHKSCLQNPRPGCGKVETDAAAIIFDSSRYRVDLFVASEFLKPVFLASESYLPESQSSLSMVASIAGAFAGGEDDDVFRFSANTITSLGRNRLRASLVADDDSNGQLENLSLAHERARWLVEAGELEFSSTGGGFLVANEFDGWRWKTTLNSRSDLKQAAASPLFVVLDQRSRVDIYKDGQLRFSEFLGAGNQELDTQSLPDGTYPVTIKITSGSGTQEVEQTFSRVATLPPQGAPQFFLERGRFYSGDDDVLRASGASFAHGGMRWRVGKAVGLETSTLNHDELGSWLQAAVLKYFTGGFANVALVNGEGGLFGHAAGLQWRNDFFAFAAEHRQLDIGDTEASTMAQERREDTLSISAGGGRNRLRLNLRSSQSEDGRKETGAVTYSRELLRLGRSAVELSTTLNHLEDDNTLMFGLRFSSLNRALRSSIATSWTHSGTGDSAQRNDANITFKHLDSKLKQHQSSFYFHNSENGDRLGGSTHFRSEQAEYSAEAQQISETDHPLYSAGFRSGLLFANGRARFAQQSAVQSGVIVGLGANATDDDVDIIVDGHPLRESGSELAQSIALQPYRTYQISVEPKTNRLMTQKNSVRSVTLYPGNVASLDWEFKPVSVLVSKVIDVNGNPVSNAYFHNLQEFSATDEGGWFQVELSGETELVLEARDGKRCRIRVPADIYQSELTVRDDVVCR